MSDLPVEYIVIASTHGEFNEYCRREDRKAGNAIYFSPADPSQLHRIGRRKLSAIEQNPVSAVIYGEPAPGEFSKWCDMLYILAIKGIPWENVSRIPIIPSPYF